MGLSLGGIFKAAIGGAAIAFTGGGALLALGAGGFIGVTSVATLVGFATTAAIMGAATYTVSSLMAGDAPRYDLSQQIRGQLVTARSPNEAMRVIYGKTRVGGVIVFLETSGEKNETLYMSVAIGRDAGFGSTATRPKVMFVSDESYDMVYSSAYAGHIVYADKTDLITFELQRSDANAAIMAGTDATNYRYNGLAVIHVKFKYDQDAFPNGLPSISFEVSGKNVYDPRETQTKYSTNAALVIRDYLLNTEYGLGARSTEIDEQSFEDAADVCDEAVAVNPYTFSSAIVNSSNRFEMDSSTFPGDAGTIVVTGTLTGTATGISAGTYYVRNQRVLYKRAVFGFLRRFAGFECDLSLTPTGSLVSLTAGTLTGLQFSFGTVTEKRYTINGTFQTSEQPQDVLRKMLTACGGKLTYQGGKWVLKVAKYYSPTVTLDEDDIVGEISVQASQSRRDIFNAVKGLYSEPTEAFQPFSFPAVTNSTYEAQDGEKIWKDAQFPFTTSSATCQRLSKIDLEKARQQITVNVSCNIKQAFALAPGDTVQLTFDRYGWTAKAFEVLTWEFSFASGESGMTPVVNLTLRETASTIYDWSLAETRIDLAPNTNLPDPFVVNPPGLAITDTLIVNAEQVVTKLVVTVTGENTFQNRYEVQAKLSTDSTYINLGEATGNIFELTGAVDGAIYNVRARSINAIGVRSAWVEGNHQVVGKTAPPQNVTGFSVNIVGPQAHLSWTAVTDLDLSHYRIRHSRLTSGATYSNAVDIETKVPRPAVTTVVPAMTGTYFIKAVDKLGIQSLVAAQSIVLIDTLPGLNVVETVIEDPTFTGAKTECAVNEDGVLVLDTAVDFDDVSGLFDDTEGDFDGGGGTTSTEGTYEFANVVDLGAIYTSRLTAVLEQTRVDYVNTFDSMEGLFDDREGLFDGDADEQGDTDVTLYVARTNDDPAGTPTWTDWRQFVVGDYKGRGFKFKAVLTSADENASPGVEQLRVTVDMPDRVISDDDIVSGTAAGGYTVTFPGAFKVAPAIGITAQNLTTGDYYEIVSKSASGFTIRFKNSGGTVVSRTFDWIAKGYGEVIT